jgi:hypothetical protein
VSAPVVLPAVGVAAGIAVTISVAADIYTALNDRNSLDFSRAELQDGGMVFR